MMIEVAAKMDAIYRVQRHFYDLTRKPYLLGRDLMIKELAIPPNGTVLEIGCGTARNLLAVAECYPTARCFGVDVSAAMLQTARRKIRRSPYRGRILVAQEDATRLDLAAQFDVAEFDRVFISYALSMIPAWQDVLVSARNLVAPGGQLHIVDFGDQVRLPRYFRFLLNTWLRRFSVSPRLDLAERFRHLAESTGDVVQIRQLHGGYAALARLNRTTLSPVAVHIPLTTEIEL